MNDGDLPDLRFGRPSQNAAPAVEQEQIFR